MNRFSDEADGFRKRRAAAVLVSRDAQTPRFGKRSAKPKKPDGKFRDLRSQFKEVGEIPHIQRHYPQERTRVLRRLKPWSLAVRCVLRDVASSIAMLAPKSTLEPTTQTTTEDYDRPSGSGTENSDLPKGILSVALFVAQIKSVGHEHQSQILGTAQRADS